VFFALAKHCSSPYLIAMTDATALQEQLDIREKLAHIDQMLADHDRKRREITYEPWKVLIAGMTAGAAFLAAGAALFAALRRLSGG
jgi:hypothetical protein